MQSILKILHHFLKNKKKTCFIFIENQKKSMKLNISRKSIKMKNYLIRVWIQMIWNHWKYIYNQIYNIRFQKLDMMIYKISFRVGWYSLSSLEKKEKTIPQSIETNLKHLVRHSSPARLWNYPTETLALSNEKKHLHFGQRILKRIKLSRIDVEFWNVRHWDIQY